MKRVIWVKVNRPNVASSTSHFMASDTRSAIGTFQAEGKRIAQRMSNALARSRL